MADHDITSKIGKLLALAERAATARLGAATAIGGSRAAISA